MSTANDRSVENIYLTEGEQLYWRRSEGLRFQKVCAGFSPQGSLLHLVHGVHEKGSGGPSQRLLCSWGERGGGGFAYPG